MNPPVPTVEKTTPVRPVPRRETPTVPTEETMSRAVRQTGALWAGITLLALVGDQAHLSLDVSHVYPDKVDAHVGVAGRMDDPVAVRDAGKLAELRAVAGLLGRPLAVLHEYDDGGLSLQVTATVADHPVRVWAALVDPDVIRHARELIAGAAVDR
ncbi:hypothetical protein FDG2_1437 [Candidatus Protofrankia californiensis]|uniref:Uncharacterized protein n=1 Tax=Candidatus Protofrankia californiensis TaxID=1839754 RepID=A0A1C3NVM5_9ACTN|nr:hypothetical protein FDG2_1437 [Candidatus Protofrankia californiensis]